MEELLKSVAGALDYPLGWLLSLPRDLTVVLVAVLTVTFMTLVRKRAINQDHMSRCNQDLRCLGAFRSTARKAKDRATVARVDATIGLIKWFQLKYELWALTVAIVPVLLLACWAFERLAYLPPQADQTVAFKAYYPLSAVGSTTHLVAPPSIQVVSAPVQVVEKADERNGMAQWTLKPASAGEAELLVRHSEDAAKHLLRVGGRSYVAPVADHATGAIERTELALTPYKFCGIVPAIPDIGFDSWIVAYCVLVLALTPVCRRALKV